MTPLTVPDVFACVPCPCAPVYVCVCTVRQVCMCARAPQKSSGFSFSRALALPLPRNGPSTTRIHTAGTRTPDIDAARVPPDERERDGDGEQSCRGIARPLDARLSANVHANTGGGQVNAFGKDVRTYLPACQPDTIILLLIKIKPAIMTLVS